jgi:hypothetical protein
MLHRHVVDMGFRETAHVVLLEKPLSPCVMGMSLELAHVMAR